MRLRLGLLAALIFSACRGGSTGEALRVELTWEPNVTSQCFILLVDGDGHAQVQSQLLLRGSKSSLQIGVFRADLPEEVRLSAVGYADADCSVESSPLERSPAVGARFSSGVTPVEVRVSRALVSDGGETDAGSDSDAGSDAGASGDGGADAGSGDAGTDAGTDAGSSDAGTDAGVDAGTAEICNNRIDDDNDGLVDCADPDCLDGAACNDANLCTTAETCSGGACVGTTFTCTGAIGVCSLPAGCDAGVCLGTPSPARTFCDGGQCDGAGRCAPFCDPTKATLAACYQFEGVLTDGSANGNNGTSVSGTFVSGSRGQAFQSGSAGVVVRDHPSLDCLNALTMEAWVKLAAWPDAGLRYGVMDDNGQYGMFIGPNGEFRCSAGVGDAVPGAVSRNAWHHLGCVFDGAGFTLKSYVDGVLLSTLDSGLPDGGARLLSTGDDAGLTVGQQSPSGDVLNGAVDGVRIWCEVRSPQDLCTTPGECG